jgi:hypothetical protein
VLCYFDDVHANPWGDSIGARLAIREFNEQRQGTHLVRRLDLT